MKKTLIGIAIAFAAACLTSSTAMATTACAIGDNVLSSGYACTIGGLTFENFSSTNYNNTVGNPPVVTLDIGTVSSNGFTLQTILPTNGNPSLNDFNLQFEVVGGVNGVGLSLNGVPAAFVTENVCTVQQTPAGSGDCPAGDLLNYLVAYGNSGTSTASFPTTNAIWIFKDISDGGSAMSETTQVYSSPVPEPATLSMMGLGLLGLGLIGRRRKG